jgi:hypothetical protein
MNTIDIDGGLLILNGDGGLIGQLTLTPLGEEERGRLIQILNDKPPLKSGELRLAIKPLFSEMVRQGIERVELILEDDQSLRTIIKLIQAIEA